MIDLTIILGFLAYSTAVGLLHRKDASRNLGEFFLAGRSLPGWKAGLSLAATQFAADTPLLATGLIATGGVYLLWRFWIYGFGYLLIALVFAECWRRANVITDAELTEERYSGPCVLWLRGLKAIYYGTIVNCFFLAMVLTAAVRVAEVFVPWHQWLPTSVYENLRSTVDYFGISLVGYSTDIDALTATTNGFLSVLAIAIFVLAYSAVGGLRAIVATDIVQFLLMSIGTIAYAGCVVLHVGGIRPMLEGLSNLYGNAEAGELLALLPTDKQALLPFFILISMQGLFWIGSDGTGYLAQRFMACRSDHDARLAGIILTWVQVLGRSIVWLVIGVGLLVIYPYTPEQAARADFAAVRELTFVRGMQDLLPTGLRGVMLAAMLAALGSTVDSHLNWGAAYWSNDLYDRLLCKSLLKRTPGPRELVAVARLSSALILLVAFVVMAHLGSIQATWMVSLVFGAGIGGVLMLRWLWHRTNVYSELAAILGSLVLAPTALIIFEEQWLQLATVSTTCLALAIGAAWFTTPTDAKVLHQFAANVRPFGSWPSSIVEGSKNRLIQRLKLTCLISTSLFCILIGLIRILFPSGSFGFVWGSLVCVGGVVLIPAWHPYLRSEALE